MTVDLPKGWEPEKPYPLTVSLHGYGPDNPLAYPSFAIGPLSPLDPNKPKDPFGPHLGIMPWGRGNSSWRGDNERDLWEAVDLLQTFAKVDRDRCYLFGHSAGADGAWAILQHTPDLWAAVGLQSGSMLACRPEVGLVNNMKYVPVYWLIGENDNLYMRIPDNKAGYELLKKLGTPTKLNIMKGVGHYPLAEDGLRDQAEFVASFVRKRPDRFSFVIDEPSHPGVWGVQMVIDPFERRFLPQPWPSFECEIKGQEVWIKTKRIRNLSIRLGDNGLRMSGSVDVYVNGKKVHSGPAPSEPLIVRDSKLKS
jgi:predicted esterase